MRKDVHVSRRAFLAASAAGAGVLFADSSRAFGAVPKQGGIWGEARALVDAGAIGRPYYVGLRMPRGVASLDDIAGHVARVSYALRLDLRCRISAAGLTVAGEGFSADSMITVKYEEGVTFSIATGRGVRAGEPYVIRGESGTLRVYDSARPHIELEEDSRRRASLPDSILGYERGECIEGRSFFG